ncbi:MAG: adenylyl-sulfate kinase [Candidatus Marinimicrobia bacterium]|nr:adenylyl-sulfate kinase [Candidatus Neomarinimicrobiota bacterium]
MSGSGKSTLSKKLIQFLENNNKTLLYLDGDEIRSKVEYKNDFSVQSIKQNSLEIIKECNIFLDLYDYIIVSVIAPFEDTRAHARKIFGDNYIEIFVNATLKELVRRDTKGLYKNALNGVLKNLIGVDSNTPYQLPTKPDLVIDTDNENEDQSFEKIKNLIR